jgi:hypothetical protein
MRSGARENRTPVPPAGRFQETLRDEAVDR